MQRRGRGELMRQLLSALRLLSPSALLSPTPRLSELPLGVRAGAWCEGAYGEQRRKAKRRAQNLGLTFLSLTCRGRRLLLARQIQCGTRPRMR